MDELKDRISELQDRLKTALQKFKLEEKQVELHKLDAEISTPNFWDDARRAQEVSRKAGTLRESVERWTALQKDGQEIEELTEIMSPQEAEAEVARIEQLLDAYETELYLSGPYDEDPAIISLHAGTGGVDAQDFTEMLARMFLRYAEKQGFKATLLDSTAGNEAGLKSASYKIEGPHAYGYLKNENGVHRLVRISPFNSKGTRETSFALIEVTPEVQESEVDIKEEDIEWDVFRSGGKGGQSVNTTDSAVRLTHKPTGIVITCQNERSQLQNKQQALSSLKGKLLALQEQFHLQTIQDIRGDHVQGSWGNQIRSYVLQPYQMVKDHRTDHETSQVYDVLDGDLQPFIEANLRK